MNKLLSYFSSENDLIKINNSDIFKITNILNSIDSISTKINIPSLVMIGSQSSGKSSLINKLLNMDLLPTGSKMVTRTPLNLQLINTKKNFYAEFGSIDNNKWTQLNRINLTSPKPTLDELENIKNYIKKLTIQYAGEQMNISHTEIQLRIYSPNIININLIDLPGLTMIACRDKGQPDDIKLQIQTLIKKYIENENNIVLCVMPAREDLETDIALEFLKQYDPNGNRTVGILTKIDLMNKNTNIINYLENNISKDLMVKYGYYAVNNSVEDDYLYFTNNDIYKDVIPKQKFGITNLGNTLSLILFNNIKSHLPNILCDIDKLYKESIVILNNLGTELPSDKNSLNSYITKFIINFTSYFINSINSKDENINTGILIKETFINYRKQINNFNPFCKSNYSDEYLQKIIKNSDGNHMSFPIPTIEVLENCLKDHTINCFRLLEPVSIECCDKIINIIEELLIDILKKKYVERFPKLNKIIMMDITNELIVKLKQQTHKKIKELIYTEEHYIWTEDKAFHNVLNNMSSNLLTTDLLREFLKKKKKP